MFKRFTQEIVRFYRQETFAERSLRMVPGALYGTLVATVFVLASSVINILFFPGQHLGVDWVRFLIQWVEFGIALAAAGAIVGWFTEDYMGIVWGGVLLTALLLIGNLLASLADSGSAALTVQSFITAVPLVGAGILLTGAIRVAINRHLYVRQQEKAEIRRKLFVQLIIIVFLVGLIPGIFSRFGASSENAVSTLNNNLQNYATDKLFEWRYPFKQVPALRDHFGMNYTLYVRTSAYEVGSMDVTIRFEDGYTITCIVPTNSGNDMLLQTCNEGSSIKSP